MRDRLTHFRATTLYGAIVLIPFVFGLYILFVLFGFLKGFLEEIAPILNTDTHLDTALLSGLVVIMILGICYLFGIVINTQLGALSFAAVESRVKDLVPGYDIVASLMRGLAGDELDYPAALISLGAPGTAVLGFVIEEVEDGYFTIFVPSCPVITIGDIHVVHKNRIQKLESSRLAAVNSITQWGIGMGKVRGGKVPEPTVNR